MPTGNLFPYSNNILFWPDIYGIPWLIGRVPTIEIIVVNTHSHKVTGTHLNIQIHQLLWIPSVNYPIAAYIFIAILRRMTEFFAMKFISSITLLIHPPGIPVTHL